MYLTLQNVGHRFARGPWLFRGVTLDFTPGKVSGLTGPSGSGKSTLLSIISGSISPVEGTVTSAEIHRVARINQSAHGVAHRLALDHISLPFLARGMCRSAANERSATLGSMFRLDDILGQPYRELSGGEAQRLMLARGVAMGADLILADEPTASLDAGNAQGVIDVLGNLAAFGAIVIVATHDPRARQACDTTLDLSDWALGGLR